MSSRLIRKKEAKLEKFRMFFFANLTLTTFQVGIMAALLALLVGGKSLGANMMTFEGEKSLKDLRITWLMIDF